RIILDWVDLSPRLTVRLTRGQVPETTAFRRANEGGKPRDARLPARACAPQLKCGMAPISAAIDVLRPLKPKMRYRNFRRAKAPDTSWRACNYGLPCSPIRCR